MLLGDTKRDVSNLKTHHCQALSAQQVDFHGYPCSASNPSWASGCSMAFRNLPAWAARGRESFSQAFWSGFYGCVIRGAPTDKLEFYYVRFAIKEAPREAI